MQQIQTVSDSELILMRIIWENGGTALYAQISEVLVQRNYNWNKNTIITFLSRLVEKGLLKANKIGKRNEYKALVSEQEYHAAQTMLLVDKVYEGDVKGLINTLIRQDMITNADKEELLRTWKGRDGNE